MLPIIRFIGSIFHFKAMRYKCILFDCDGVLVDSEALTNGVLVEMAAELGIHLPINTNLQGISGRSLHWALEYIEQQTGMQLPDTFVPEYRSRTFKLLARDLETFPGIYDLLERLTIDYCVASSGPLEKIRTSLTTTRLIPFFEGRMYSSYQIQSWKPDPGIFLYAAAQMGYAPKDCVVIEDSLAGIQAAQAGGFDVLHFRPEAHLPDFNLPNVPVFDQLGNLDKLLINF